MATLLNIKFTMPKWAETVTLEMNHIKGKAMATMQTNRGLLFRNEGAYNGHAKWKDIQRSGQILADTGTLKNSLAPKGSEGDKPVSPPNGIIKFTGDVITMQTNVKYAAIHNYGGIIKPKSKDMLRWKDASGWHAAKQVKIPKRPFLEGAWNAEDQQELNDTMTNFLKRLLNGVKA